MVSIEQFEELCSLASKMRLVVEDKAILFTEDMGRGSGVFLDRWLYLKAGRLHIEVRVMHGPAGSDDWQPMVEANSEGSDVHLGLEEARNLVEHWGTLERDSVRRAELERARERERVFAPLS